MSKFRTLYHEKLKSLKECLDLFSSGDVVVFATMCNTPDLIMSQFHTAVLKLENLRAVLGQTNQHYPFICEKGMKEHVLCTGTFWGPDMVLGNKLGNSSYLPMDIQGTSAAQIAQKPTVFVSCASPMDENGNFQVGLSNMSERDVMEYVIASGGKIILEVNRQIPLLNGGALVHIRDVTAFVEVDRPLMNVPVVEPTPEEQAVARNVRSLLRDGDCVQVGIGALPDAVMAQCMDLKDLGLHTEMVTTALGQMIQKGVITGERKTIHKGEHLFTFCGGDRALYDTISRNPQCQILPGSYINDPFIIAQNNNMVSLNTCIAIDLSGQIASESIGFRQHSGSGGALNFAYGALRSKGGRGIMAFTSKSKKGVSKITGMLAQGTIVTIPRNYADYVVTEYGIAPLRNRTVRERALNLIAIAHPDFRADLMAEAQKMNYI